MISLLAVVVSSGLTTSPVNAAWSAETPSESPTLTPAPSPSPSEPPSEPSSRSTTRSSGPGEEDTRVVSPLRAHLTRPVARSVHHLDHGVIGVDVGLGHPHVYRLGVAVGVLDRLTIGATAHWLPGQAVPGWSPTVALALYRGPRLEVGATYFQLLSPPPPLEPAADEDNFQQRAHYLMGHVSFAQAWFTAGVDLGWARGREADPFPEDTVINNPDAPPYFTRNRLAGGLHLRVGTRRLGVVTRALFPYPMIELALQVRFGAFEMRPRGGWWIW